MDVQSTVVIEPWVDAAVVAAHLGFKEDHIRNLARQGKIPGVPSKNGKRTFWRFKLSQVDEAWARLAVRMEA